MMMVDDLAIYKTVRTLLNDSMAYAIPDTELQPLLALAIQRAPFLVASLVLLSNGGHAGSEKYSAWAVAHPILPKPIATEPAKRKRVRVKTHGKSKTRRKGKR